MWMDDPTQSDSLTPQKPPSMALGTEQASFGTLMQGLSSLINTHKSQLSAPPHFHVVDMKLGDGEFAAGLVDHYRTTHTDGSRPIVISGIDTNPQGLGDARDRLADKSALGQVHEIDAANTVASTIRNRLECAGGSDLVLFSHAGYDLPAFKLPRMVDRLSDMVAPYGAVVTVHNHGASDAHDIRGKVMGIASHATPGLRCDTHPRLEQAFAGGKLTSFSVTVPNVVKLPANAVAIEAIFSGNEAVLGGKDAVDAAQFRSVLEVIAGGKDTFDTAIANMDETARDAAIEHFADKMAHARGGEMAITVGGGQMVMAFRDPQLARQAFGAISKAAGDMSPPALALPISPALTTGFDKQAAHANWKAALEEDHGITNPPAVPQALGAGRNR